MNKTRISQLLENFRTVTGTDVSILNADFHTLASAKGEVSRICAYIHRAQSSRDICKASDIERLVEVRDSGDAVTYTCPCGITEAIAPIIRGDSIIAYLIATMGISENDSGDVEHHIRSAVPLPEGDELREKIQSTRILTDKELTAHFEMLKMLGEHIASDRSFGEESESIGTMVKYYVKSNLSNKLTLPDIANSLHCSTVTLTEHFKAEFGITVMEYVARKRMELAEKLMLITDAPLREIAVKTGFADVEYFSRTFKKYHGVSPASWRKANSVNT